MRTDGRRALAICIMDQQVTEFLGEAASHGVYAVLVQVVTAASIALPPEEWRVVLRVWRHHVQGPVSDQLDEINLVSRQGGVARNAPASDRSRSARSR